MYNKMTLQKAIEIMELNLTEAGKHMPPDCKAAVKLLIEAGKTIQMLRPSAFLAIDEPLPGETKE